MSLESPSSIGVSLTTIALATAELDRWANLGKTGWDYQSLLPLLVGS